MSGCRWGRRPHRVPAAPGPRHPRHGGLRLTRGRPSPRGALRVPASVSSCPPKPLEHPVWDHAAPRCGPTPGVRPPPRGRDAGQRSLPSSTRTRAPPSRAPGAVGVCGDAGAGGQQGVWHGRPRGGGRAHGPAQSLPPRAHLRSWLRVSPSFLPRGSQAAVSALLPTSLPRTSPQDEPLLPAPTSPGPAADRAHAWRLPGPGELPVPRHFMSHTCSTPAPVAALTGCQPYCHVATQPPSSPALAPQPQVP